MAESRVSRMERVEKRRAKKAQYEKNKSIVTINFRSRINLDNLKGIYGTDSETIDYALKLLTQEYYILKSQFYSKLVTYDCRIFRMETDLITRIVITARKKGMDQQDYINEILDREVPKYDMEKELKLKRRKNTKKQTESE